MPAPLIRPYPTPDYVEAKLKPRNRQRLLNEARISYCHDSDDDVEVDDNALIHRSGNRGMWVAAWVYVPASNLKPLTPIRRRG